eukprot:TRINITY_DN12219_c0_g1_i1.p1 TRINITY_DN12219_c0_g1~~TRINITY_DN12219_c0_g1_i1.p1  ORF type:complete len:280 (+),score=70.98 TRINITY_DN12219_c0_g1_i1:39-842(+)
MIVQVTDRLKGQYEIQFGTGKVQTIGNYEVNLSELDPDIAYFQIAPVQVYLDDKELTSRSTPYLRQFNIDKFLLEVPFVESGKKNPTLADQKKKKTFLQTDIPFPYVSTRIAVSKKEVVILEPIQNAYDLIHGKNQSLQIEVKRQVKNTKTLQILLQGIVSPQINAGPLEICEVFLSDPSKHDEKHVKKLQECIITLLDLCGKGISINRNLINDQNETEINFQKQLETGFQNLKNEVITKYVKDARMDESDSTSSTVGMFFSPGDDI